MESMGPADIAALNKDSSGFGGSNSWAWIIVLLLIFGGGAFGYGNRTEANTVNNDFMYTNLSSQVRDLGTLTNTGFQNATNQNFAIQQDILSQTNQINQNLCSGFNGVNTNIAALASQMAQQCCDLKTTVHAEGEATRALITENTIQQLRTDLQAAQLTLGNANQTQNILNALGSYRPYTYCSGCGCSGVV